MSYFKVTSEFLCFAALITALAAFVLPEGSTLKRGTDSSSSEETDELEESLEALNDMCMKNADQEAFERVVNRVLAVPGCVGEKVDLKKITEDIENLNAANRRQFFSTYCPQLNDSLTCLDAATAEVRKCIDDDLKELYDLTNHQLIPKALQIACKNDGEIFFLGMDKIELCFTSIADNQTGCFANMSNSTDELNINTLGPKECTEVAGLRQCVQNHLNDCKLDGLMELVDLFYQSFIKMTPCENYIPSDDDNRISQQ